MSKHFADALYYLKRAGEHAKLGVVETIGPVEQRARAFTGRESEPEPSRVEAFLGEVQEAERKAEGEARAAIGSARQRLDAYRASH